ncbi:MAG: 1-(5-phosphoribosyl)-5-amino-4-imidazole-carboxylate carboxylase, partial [Clostridia bacterium]|nr:1-(5-phosphoribosyl)-5-amino-4-imidazole-carboxylate carboxylase [Clostridia bacterium]
MTCNNDLHFAKPDYARQQRCGVPEVIYGAGKTAPQIVAIMRALNDAGQNAFATR